MKNIIVPIDFSPDSFKGLEMAILFSQKTELKIHLIYVQESNGRGLALRKGAAVSQKFKKIEEEYSPRLGNKSELVFITRKGKRYKKIVDYADELPESLIIATIYSDEKHIFKLIASSNCPVLIFSEGYPMNFTKIVLPINYITYSRQKVPIAAEVARIFDAEVHILGISSHNKRIIKRVTAYSLQACKYFFRKGIAYKSFLFQTRQPENKILEYAVSVGADLIIVMTKRKRGLARMFVDKEIRKLVTQSSIPILCIKQQTTYLLGSFSATGG
ncbi:MAG: universal stress protein [Bacteroidota bacterium]|nr:universal stress protein [Bacteroidota bacterium]MDP4225889.1 universal stress protein [Bacteroidota bacterium]MDP4273593.1 universal stress protein [Bacteroidota bacterium]